MITHEDRNALLSALDGTITARRRRETKYTQAGCLSPNYSKGIARLLKLKEAVNNMNAAGKIYAENSLREQWAQEVHFSIIENACPESELCLLTLYYLLAGEAPWEH